MKVRPLAPSAYTENRRAKTARKYRTHCKLCGEAVFMDEAAMWLLSPLGLSHERCVTA